MKVIGICGGSGSGKGAACSVFRTLGIPSIDTDAVYHSIVSRHSPCLNELVSEFGSAVVRDGVLDRARLREIVFTPPGVKQRQSRLNEITHKYVIEATEQALSEYEQNEARGVIIDAPMLIESGLDARCDIVVAVLASTEVRVARIMLRDGISEEAARKRIAAQLSDTALKERADFVIANDGTLDELRRSVIDVHNKIFTN